MTEEKQELENKGPGGEKQDEEKIPVMICKIPLVRDPKQWIMRCPKCKVAFSVFIPEALRAGAMSLLNPKGAEFCLGYTCPKKECGIEIRVTARSIELVGVEGETKKIPKIHLPGGNNKNNLILPPEFGHGNRKPIM